MKTYQIYINGKKSGISDGESAQDAIDSFVYAWGAEIEEDAKVEAYPNGNYSLCQSQRRVMKQQTDGIKAEIDADFYKRELADEIDFQIAQQQAETP